MELNGQGGSTDKVKLLWIESDHVSIGSDSTTPCVRCIRPGPRSLTLSHNLPPLAIEDRWKRQRIYSIQAT